MSNVLYTETHFSSTALEPHRIIDFDGAGKAQYAGEDTTFPLGVTDELGCKNAGDPVDIDMLGVVLVRVAEPVHVLDAIAPGAEGKGVVARGLSMATLGVALERAAAANTIIRVLRVGAAAAKDAMLVRAYEADGVVTRGHAVKMADADGEVEHATASGDVNVGIAITTAANGARVWVAHGGLVQAIAHAAVVRGSRVRGAAGGKLLATSTASHGVAGIALGAAVANGPFPILVMPSSV